MITFDKCSSFKGEITVPSDKSITHRAIIMSAMADGVSLVRNPLKSRDTIATLNAFKMAGVDVVQDSDRFIISSSGWKNFKEPWDVIDCQNSGTTARLLAGVFAPQQFYTVFTGDNSLKRRPMARVIEPLSQFGANIKGRADNTLLPFSVIPSDCLTAAHIEAKTKSAQVKSAVLLAAAQIEGQSSYRETTATRDHTERMLAAYGVDVKVDGGVITVNGGKSMTQFESYVPGDFSSAAFFIVAALMFEGSEIIIKNCGLNPSRTGLLKVLKDFGVHIETETVIESPEPIGNIYIKYSKCAGGKVSGDIIANMIDEIPVLALLGLFSENPVEIRDAAELRVKESDRIAAIAENFRAIGAEVDEFSDGLKVYPLKSDVNKAVLKSFDDHRICMVNILLAKKFGIKMLIDNIDPLDVSFPDFIGWVMALEEK
ncbi:MAG: 3-phosphoshikimate 1-carboxyvinyltransferase [Deferribacterales bacterium]|nr:3-phosphoshikimate 1-carboxyvinyltransferase [Deferribacterales bacterium]